jgi:hypothetical protein
MSAFDDKVIVEVTNPETPFGGVQVVGPLSTEALAGPVTVEIFNPETPFGGVQVEGAGDSSTSIEINTGSPVLSVFGRIGHIQPLFTDYDQFYMPLGAMPEFPTGPPGATEVWEGTEAPDPQGDYLLWIDTDEPTPIGGGGGTGGGDVAFVHNQVAVSASWSITHNLGKFPSVNVVDSGGSLIIPNVTYVDSNHVTISFAAATSGKAYLN